jgi:hypothetical protein
MVLKRLLRWVNRLENSLEAITDTEHFSFYYKAEYLSNKKKL